MTPLEQLLVGLVVVGAGLTLAFWVLWYRELERHARTIRSRDMLREQLRKTGSAPPRQNPLAEAMLAANVGLRLPDEQRMMNQIRDADHFLRRETWGA